MEITDSTKRTERIARKMRIQPGIDVPAKAQLAGIYKMDLETIWRVLNGVPLEGSRGKTIERVMEENGGK